MNKNKSETEYLKINYRKIKDHIAEQEKLDPERTRGEIDFLRSGIEHNLLNILSSEGSDTWIIEINHEDKRVTMLWDQIIQWELEFLWAKNYLSQDEKLY